MYVLIEIPWVWTHVNKWCIQHKLFHHKRHNAQINRKGKNRQIRGVPLERILLTRQSLSWCQNRSSNWPYTAWRISIVVAAGESDVIFPACHLSNVVDGVPFKKAHEVDTALMSWVWIGSTRASGQPIKAEWIAVTSQHASESHKAGWWEGTVMTNSCPIVVRKGSARLNVPSLEKTSLREQADTIRFQLNVTKFYHESMQLTTVSRGSHCKQERCLDSQV